MTCTTCDGATYDICIVRHQVWTQEFRVESDGAPMDLTGATIELLIQPVTGDLVRLNTSGGEVVITPPATDGVFVATMSASDTYDMAAGEGSWELWINSERYLVGAASIVDTIWSPP